MLYPHCLAHWCKPLSGLEPETLGVNLSIWQDTFLPVELGPTFQRAGCHMYNVTVGDVPKLLDGSMKGSEFGLVECRHANGYEYDRR